MILVLQSCNAHHYAQLDLIVKNMYIAIKVNPKNLKKKLKKTEKFPWMKSILVLILHMISNFFFIWTANKYCSLPLKKTS